MNTINATWRNGQILLDKAANWPEGKRLVIIEEPLQIVDFMTEEEQSDDPAAIDRWINEVQALPAMYMSPEDEAQMVEWRRKAKEFNLEAMRRQMAEDHP